MPPSSSFSASYDREKGVLRVEWKGSGASFFACPNSNRDISKAILANLTQQWDTSVMREIGLSNLVRMNTADVIDALSGRLPQDKEFSFSGVELVEILKTI